MKKTAFFAAALLALGFCSQALALDLGAGLRLGYLSPTGGLGDTVDGGTTVGLAGEVVSMDFLAVEAAVSRARLDMEGVWEEKPDLEKWLLELNGKVYFMPDRALNPYVKGGIVADFWEVEALDIDGKNFGLDGGVGLSYSLTSNLSLGGEAAYYYLWSDRDNEELLGDDMTFWNLFIGLTFRP